MLRRIALGALIAVALGAIAFSLRLFAPYYNAFIAEVVNFFASDLADVTTDAERLIVTRVLPEATGGDQVVTTNGYLLQLSYLIFAAVVIGAWLLDIRWRRALAIVTLIAIPVSHLVGVWLDTLEVKDPDRWVQTSRTVSLVWALVPVLPMMASLIVQRVYLAARNQGGGRKGRRPVAGR